MSGYPDMRKRARRIRFAIREATNARMTYWPAGAPCPSRKRGLCSAPYASEPGEPGACRTFECVACKRRLPQCFGAADDQPTVCNDCYVVEGDVPELGPRPTEPCS